IQPGLFRYVRERAVAVVVEESECARWVLRVGCWGVTGQVFVRDDENIKPTVVVVVEERAAAADGFRHPFLAESAVRARAVQPGSARYICKDDICSRRDRCGRPGGGRLGCAARQERRQQEQSQGGGLPHCRSS